MAAAKLGGLLAQQVERAKAQEAVVVQFAATLPSDGSQVNLDWWLRQINSLLAPVSISLEFADLDKPASSVGQLSPIQAVQMKRKMEEMQLLINDLENNLHEKAANLAETMVHRGVAALSPKSQILHAVNEDGFYVDARGAKWVDIVTEAKRTGKSYSSLWRGAKGIGINRIESMVVGTTQANGDRILVKEGSFTAGKRRKKGQK